MNKNATKKSLILTINSNNKFEEKRNIDVYLLYSNKISQRYVRYC